ncbi:hypothetical protein ACT1U9_03220 [Streptomyces sp. BR1]|uniref:hypothetical protein n=1 Tax=Streptomyces sp. BR1 TaxID=1592323 RepID=UPI00402B78F9
MPAQQQCDRHDRPGSQSGTLTHQLVYELRETVFSTAAGTGGDPIAGTSRIDCLAALEAVGVRVGSTPTGTARLLLDRLDMRTELT